MFYVVPGATDQTIYFVLRDSSNFLAKTGLLYNSAGASCTYTRKRGTATTITLATLAAANSAHADGGFKEVDATNAKGLYRLDLPDAAVATGADYVLISIEFDGVVEAHVVVHLEDVPASAWANATRTLTQSAAAAYSAVSGDTITIKRGDDNSISLTGLGALGAWTKLYFSIKERFSDTDAQSLVQIVLSNPGAGTDGLTILNASTSGLTAANGSITVDDAADGDITIRLKQAEAATLSPATSLKYDVQVIRSSGIAVQTLTDGKAVIEGDVTRAVS